MGQFLQVIFYLGAAQGLLFSLYLFSLKVNKISNRLLGLLTFSWSVILLQFALQGIGIYREFPHLYKTTSNLVFALGPLHFLFVKYLLYDLKRFRKTDLWHFLPLVLNILIAFDFYFLSGPEKIAWIKNKPEFNEIASIVANEVIATQGIVYSILILVRLKRYKNEVENFSSNIDREILRALFIGVVIILIAWIIGAIDINLELFAIRIKTDLFIYVYLLIVLVIYFTSFVAIRTPEIFKIDANEMREVFLNRNKPEKNVDDAQNADATKENPEYNELDLQLISVMENEKPYLEPDLNLLQLAEKVGLSRNQLSYLINQNHGMNFNEFVNSYRIEEVKRLMHDPANKHLKLMSLAYDAGFNSKASFNRIFKQMTSMTPSQYYSLQEVG